MNQNFVILHVQNKLFFSFFLNFPLKFHNFCEARPIYHDLKEISSNIELKNRPWSCESIFAHFQGFTKLNQFIHIIIIQTNFNYWMLWRHESLFAQYIWSLSWGICMRSHFETSLLQSLFPPLYISWGDGMFVILLCSIYRTVSFRDELHSCAPQYTKVEPALAL